MILHHRGMLAEIDFGHGYLLVFAGGLNGIVFIVRDRRGIIGMSDQQLGDR